MTDDVLSKSVYRRLDAQGALPAVVKADLAAKTARIQELESQLTAEKATRVRCVANEKAWQAQCEQAEAERDRLREALVSIREVIRLQIGEVMVIVQRIVLEALHVQPAAKADAEEFDL